LTAVLLALAASLSWGVADFGAGVGSRRLPPLVVGWGMQLTGCIVAGAVVLVLWDHPPTWKQALWAVTAGTVGLIGIVSLYTGLSIGPMGIVGPLSATAALVPLAYGLARGERPSSLQLAGVALAIVGIIGASLEPLPEGRGRKIGAGVGFGLLAALGFGWSLIALNEAAAGGTPWAVLIMRVCAVPTLFLLASARGLPRPGRSHWKLLAGVGLVDTAATLLYAAASTRGLLSVVAVLASLYPIVIIVCARVLLHERIARTQLAGAAVALAGVALVSAGG
jgi:drug/metabolite transporter (DMT)-like permease